MANVKRGVLIPINSPGTTPKKRKIPPGKIAYQIVTAKNVSGTFRLNVILDLPDGIALPADTTIPDSQFKTQANLPYDTTSGELKLDNLGVELKQKTDGVEVVVTYTIIDAKVGGAGL